MAGYNQLEWDFQIPQRENDEEFLLTKEESEKLLEVFNFLLQGTEPLYQEFQVVSKEDITQLMENFGEKDLIEVYNISAKILNSDHWTGEFISGYYADGKKAIDNQGRCLSVLSNQKGINGLMTIDKYPQLYDGIFTITSRLKDIKETLQLNRNAKYVSFNEYATAKFIVDYYNPREMVRVANDHTTRDFLSRKVKTQKVGEVTQIVADIYQNREVKVATLDIEKALGNISSDDFETGINELINRLENPVSGNILMILENHNYLQNKNTLPMGDITFTEIADIMGISKAKGVKSRFANTFWNALETLTRITYNLKDNGTTFHLSYLDVNKTHYNRKTGKIHYEFASAYFDLMRYKSALYPKELLQIPQNKATARLLAYAFIQHYRLNLTKHQTEQTLSVQKLTESGIIKHKEEVGKRVTQLILLPLLKDLEYLVTRGTFKSYKLKHKSKAIPKASISKLKYDTFIECMLTVELTIQPCYPELNQNRIIKERDNIENDD